MLSIQMMIRSRMIDAVKAKDPEARGLYRFLSGKFDNLHEQPVSDETAIKTIRSLLNDSKVSPGAFSPREIELMSALVPSVLNAEETRNFLIESGVVDQIKAMPKDGPAIGIAMKTFAKGQRCVDGETVKSVVAALRMEP